MTAVLDETAELRDLALRADADGAAMNEFIRRTRGVVWRMCATLVDPVAADDLTQDTFVRAVRSLRTYRSESSPVTWLSTIARRVCAEEIALRQRARALGVHLAVRCRSAAVDDTALVDLVDAVDRLIPERRIAFLRTAVAGLSYDETATMCGCPVGTIRSRVARARSDLVEALSDDLAWPERVGA